MLSYAEAWVVVSSATLAAVIGFGIALLSKLGSLSAIRDATNRLEASFFSLIQSIWISTFFSRTDTSKELEQRIKKISEYLNHTIAKKNPLSAEEIGRLRGYCEKMGKRTPLNYEEYTDFEELRERVKKELPRKEKADFELLLAGLIGFAAGVALSELIRSLIE